MFARDLKYSYFCQLIYRIQDRVPLTVRSNFNSISLVPQAQAQTSSQRDKNFSPLSEKQRNTCCFRDVHLEPSQISYKADI